jgi:hypothetical protein
MRLLIGAVGIEFASLTSKSSKAKGVAPPPCSNWSLMEPTHTQRRPPLVGTIVLIHPPVNMQYERKNMGQLDQDGRQFLDEACHGWLLRAILTFQLRLRS